MSGSVAGVCVQKGVCLPNPNRGVKSKAMPKALQCLQPKERPVDLTVGEAFDFEEVAEEAGAPGLGGVIGGGANEGEDELFARTIGVTIVTIEETE